MMGDRTEVALVEARIKFTSHVVSRSNVMSNLMPR